MLFNWPPDGGARVDIVETAKALESAGHQVKLFFPDFNTLYFPRGRIKEEPGIPYEKIPFHHVTFFPYLIKKRFLKQVDRFGPDVVFIGDAYFLKPHLILAFSRRYRTVARFFAYEILCPKDYSMLKNGTVCRYNYLNDPGKCMPCAMEEMKEGLQNMQLNLWSHEFLISGGYLPGYHSFVRKALKSLDTIIVYNEFTKKMLSDVNEKVRVVPGGINKNLMDCGKAGREPNKHNPEKKIILMTGRASDPRKGYETLKQAGKILAQKRDDFEIWATHVEKSLNGYMRQTGWLSHKETLELYYKSYVCVFPPIWPEPFGIVAVEAMAAGKPVVASDGGGLKDIVLHGKTGFLFPPGDSQKLAENLQRLLDDPQLAKSMGEEGRARAEKNFTWDNIVRTHYEEIF